MKKLIACVLLIPVLVFAGLTYSATTHTVALGSGASMDALTTVTVLTWIYRTSETANDTMIWWKGDETSFAAFGSCMVMGTSGVAGGLYLDKHKTTTDLKARQSVRSVVLNEWSFVGCQYQTAGTATDQKLFYGNLATPAVEVSSYSAQTAGTGTVPSDAAFNVGIGNSAAAQTFWETQGTIAWVGVWNRALTLGEIKAQQFRPHRTSGNVLFMHLGYNGTGTQPDWSGNGNSGTVTGAVVGRHMLGFPFGR